LPGMKEALSPRDLKNLDCPEQTYLRACLAHMLDPRAARPQPAEGLDWALFGERVRQHRLSGVFYVWGKSNPVPWPAEVDQELGQNRYQTLFFGDLFEPHVRRVLAALRDAAIPVMVLKGWAFIQRIYGGDYSQRGYADIDLLVPPEEAEKAEIILQGLGYQPQSPEPWPGHIRRFRNGRAYLSEQPLTPFSLKFMAGLHWGLLDTPYFDRRMDLGAIFERARSISVAEVEVLEPDLADLLVYAWGHLGLHHEYDPELLRYYEFAWLIRHAGEGFSWETVIERAVDWRLVLPLQRVLPEIEQLSPGTVPPEVLEHVRGLRPTRGERLIHNLVTGDRGNATLRAALAWLSMPGLGRRLRFLLETAFPSPAYMRQRYGSAEGDALPLLYLRRYGNALRQITGFISRPRT
jgi:hypothetical protein